jgi:putative ABC transport system ATP-binding protein
MDTSNEKVLVKLRSLHKTYRLGETVVQALRGVNLDIHQGEFTALIGTSGSGKSTLLNLIGCLDVPDSGEIIFADKNVNLLTESEKSHFRSQKISFIFQSFNLIPVLDVFENIELPLTINESMSASERKDRVLKVLHEVGLSEFVHHLPEKLSGGQRQRVAIARALVTGPSLVLADEPTANLDSDTAHKIIDLLMNLNKKEGLTFFFCSHDEKLIGRVGRVVHIQDGVIKPS